MLLNIPVLDLSSNRTSQQTRFNKKKTGEEESFVLDFAYNPEAIDRLYLALGQTARIVSASGQNYSGDWDYIKITNPENIPWEDEWKQDIKGSLILLEVPIMSSKTYIFGYADMVVLSRYREAVWTNIKGINLQAIERMLCLLIEVKSERTSTLDLIKQLRSYSQFHGGLPVFIHLYDLEEREIRALKANGIHPVDGRMLIENGA